MTIGKVAVISVPSLPADRRSRRACVVPCWGRSCSTPPTTRTSTWCSWPSPPRTTPPRWTPPTAAPWAWPPCWGPRRVEGEGEVCARENSTSRTWSPTLSCAYCSSCWCCSLCSSSTVSCGTLSSPPCRMIGHCERRGPPTNKSDQSGPTWSAYPTGILRRTQLTLNYWSATLDTRGRWLVFFTLGVWGQKSSDKAKRYSTCPWFHQMWPSSLSLQDSSEK